MTGYHRKHAIRVLREETNTKATRARNRLYDEAVRQALMVLWEAVRVSRVAPVSADDDGLLRDNPENDC